MSLSLFSLCGAVVSVACAQTAVDGAVRGTITDPSGSLLADSHVRILNPATSFVRSTTTAADGSFFIPQVPPGDYVLAAESYGLFTGSVARVVVQLGSVTRVNLTLSLSGATTSVAVTPEDEVALDTTAASLVISEAEIQQLPVTERRWQSFALLSPPVNPSSQEPSLLSFRGLAVTQNATTIDGMSDDQSFNAIPRGTSAEPSEEDSSEQQRIPGDVGLNAGASRHSGATYTFSQAAVREFRISPQNETAIYGHGSGGIISTITRGGTNELHGAAFYNVRDSAWASANPFSIATRYNDGAPTSALVKPHDLRQQFGGRIGGPALRERLFYFYSYDQQRRGFPAISSPEDASFYSLTATQSALLANRGVSSAKIHAALNYLDSLTGPVNRRSDQTLNFAKLDWHVNDNHRLSLQYNRLRSSAPGGLRDAAVVDRGTASLGSAFVNVDSAVVRWLWIASPTVTNELRFAYGRDLQWQEAQRPLPQEPAIGPEGYAPEVSIGPQGILFGTPASLGRRAYPDERRIQVADLVSWQRGHHLVQVGLDLSLIHDHIDALNNTEGTFHYDSDITNGHAGGLVDWITDYTFNVNAYPNGGCPSIHASLHLFCFRSYTQSFGQSAVSFDTQEWAGFVQDTWRASKRLTVTAGVRYEYQLEPLPQRPNAALDAVFGSIGATSIFPEDRNNFGPRVGIAWEPLGTRRGIVHVAYGVYYGSLPGATIRSALVNTALPTSATNIRFTPATVTDCPQVANQGFGYVCSYVSTPPAAVGRTTAAAVFDRRFRLPMVQQGSFSLEREVGARTVLKATYLFNLDRQLPSSVDINVAPSTQTEVFQLQGGTGVAGVRDGERFVLPVYTQRVDPDFGPVTAILSNANASYNAVVVEGRRRGRGGLQFRASWIWSKALDSGASMSAAPRTNGQMDPFTNGYDRGLSATNLSHRVTADVVWEPRVHGSGEWMRRLGNGWSVASIFTESSGRPYTYQVSGGTRLPGGRESINGAGGAVYLPTVGRNTLRLPDTANVDLRVSRWFSISKRVRARASAQAYNLVNHVNYSGISERAFLVGSPVAGVTPLIFQDAATVASEGLNTAPFGTYRAASSGVAGERRIELSVRLEF
jgi:hypothetical protein